MIMELTYTKVGDYYIPALVLDDDAELEIGMYGRMRERFWEEHHHGAYTSLLLTGRLWKHFAAIDTASNERMDSRHLPKLAVEALNGIGGIDQPPYLLGILEAGAQIGPIIPPGL